MKKIQVEILDTWLIRPFLKFLRTGLSPVKLALSFSIGICLGLTPIPGTSTLTCAIAAIYFRLNLGAIQLINYIVYPLQILLIYPFFKAGAFITGSEIFSGTAAEISGKFHSHFWESMSELGFTAVAAVAIWAIISIPTGILLYKVSLPIFRKLIAKEKNMIEKAV